MSEQKSKRSSKLPSKSDVPDHIPVNRLDDGRPKREIRSFVIRSGRMTEGQLQAYREAWPDYGLNPGAPLDFASIYGREAPQVLEIGFGMGDSLAQMARDFPDYNYLGIEVHKPGVGRLLRLAQEGNLRNLRVMNTDAVEVLRTQVADASLDRLQLFFPDPWHKKRHHKRRIVQPEFVQLVRQKLKPGGHFHMATDWQQYAEQMLEVMSQAEGFRNTSQTGDYVPRPDYRPTTKFEKRGERLGHGVWDLIFERTD